MSAVALLRGCVGIPLVLLSGCHARTSDHPLAPPTAVAASSTPFTVPQDPVYEQAVGKFRRHDFPGALAGINTLLVKPQYAQNPADRVFLLHQRAICRHAIDPRVSADDRSVSPPLASPPPVHPAPVPLTTVPLTIAQADCGPRALVLVCAALHQPASLPALRSAAGTTAKGTTLAGLVTAAKQVGLKAKGEQVDLPALKQLSDPAIAWVDGNHYVAVLAVNGDTVTIHDPNSLRKEDIPASILLARSGGVLLTISR